MPERGPVDDVARSTGGVTMPMVDLGHLRLSGPPVARRRGFGLASPRADCYLERQLGEVPPGSPRGLARNGPAGRAGPPGAQVRDGGLPGDADPGPRLRRRRPRGRSLERRRPSLTGRAGGCRARPAGAAGIRRLDRAARHRCHVRRRTRLERLRAQWARAGSPALRLQAQLAQRAPRHRRRRVGERT